MAVKVIYKCGTKKAYLDLKEYNPYALYWLEDARELRKGADLYSDGIRMVSTFESMPTFDEAADGILYVCEDTGNGYVLNSSRDGWTSVFHGVDNGTIWINESGLMSVKSVPISAVTDLQTKLDEISQAISRVETIPIASHEIAGKVKPNADEFEIAEDGTMSILKIDARKISGLSASGENTFNSDQFDVTEGAVSIKKIDTSVIQYNGMPMDDVLPGIIDSAVWESF